MKATRCHQPFKKKSIIINCPGWDSKLCPTVWLLLQFAIWCLRLFGRHSRIPGQIKKFFFTCRTNFELSVGTSTKSKQLFWKIQNFERKKIWKKSNLRRQMNTRIMRVETLQMNFSLIMESSSLALFHRYRRKFTDI